MSVRLPFFLAGLVFLAFTASAQWTRIADYGGPASDGAVSFAIDGKGYVGAGPGVQDFWEYTPETNSWRKRANIGGGVRGWAFGFSLNGKAYVGCGDPTASFSPVDDVWEFDPATNTWTQMQDFPGGPRDGLMCFVLGNKAYIGCGFDGADLYDDVYEFDPATDTWTPMGTYPGGVILFPVSFVIGSKAYVGVGTRLPETKDFYEFDPSLPNPWTQKTDFGGDARQAAVGFAANGKGYIGLGLSGDYNNPTKYRDIWEYDPTANTWTVMSEQFPSTITGWSSAFAINDVAYVGLGADLPSFQATKAFYKYVFGNILTTTISQNTLAFGNVKQGTMRDTVITIGNEGKTDLTVTAMTIMSDTGSVFSVSGATFPFTVMAGGTQDVTVRFAPNYPGLHVAVLKIESNASNGAEMLFDLRGTGTSTAPTINVAPGTVDFGDVKIGEVGDTAIFIRNMGESALTVTEILEQNDASGVFSTSIIPTLPAMIAPGDSTYFTVEFIPSAAQTYSANILIRSNAANMPEATIPLAGKGIAPETSSIEVEPGEINFGQLAPGEMRGDSVTIRNTGAGPLHVSSIAIMNDTAGVFSFSGVTAPLIIPAGGSQTVSLQYAPQWAGFHFGTLRIASDASNAPFKDVMLSGLSAPKNPKIETSPDTILIAGVTVGTTKDTTFEIRNTGTGPLEVFTGTVIEDTKGVFSVVGPSGSFTLAPTEAKEIIVRFSPMEENTFTARVRIESNDPANPVTHVVLEGRSVATVSVNPLRDAHAATLEAYPNPVSMGSIITCKITSQGNGATRIALVDLLGRVVASQETNSPKVGSVQFNLARYSVSPGLYYLILSNGASHTRAPLMVIR